MGSNMYGGFENMGGYGNGYGLTTGSYSRYWNLYTLIYI
jgi:hypothetical protein